MCSPLSSRPDQAQEHRFVAGPQSESELVPLLATPHHTTNASEKSGEFSGGSAHSPSSNGSSRSTAGGTTRTEAGDEQNAGKQTESGTQQQVPEEGPDGGKTKALTTLKAGTQQKVPDKGPDEGKTTSASSWVQRLVVGVSVGVVSVLFLGIPYLSAFKQYDGGATKLGKPDDLAGAKQHDGDATKLGKPDDLKDTKQYDEDTTKLGKPLDLEGAIQSTRIWSHQLSRLRNNLTFLLWFCTSLLPFVVGSMLTAYQVNDAMVMNLAAVTACLLLMAILHVRCLQHLAEGLEESDHETLEAAIGSWPRTFKPQVSFLVAAPFVWAAWALILFLVLAVSALLRLPIPPCEVDAEVMQTIFPPCRLLSASADIFIHLKLPCRIITAVTVVLGTLHGAFNFYHLSQG